MKNITFLKVEIESLSPLHIGDNEGKILIDLEENKAYLPATSIAGSFRAYLKQSGENYKALFGNQDKKEGTMSKIFISDSFAEVKNIEKRIGVRIDSRTGSNKKGSKIDREYLGKGLLFNLWFEVHSNNDEKEQLLNMLYMCLKALDENRIKLGGYKTAGLGNFKINDVKEKIFDLAKFDDLQAYLKKEYSNMKDMTHKVKNYAFTDTFVELNLSGELSTPMLIKAPDTLESEGPDAVNLKSSSDYIVPGSSVKGLIRGRLQKIAAYFGKEEVIESVFGSESDKKASSILVDEVVIDDEGFNNEIIYNRIKIDKFTGGTMNSALMNDKPIMGKGSFKVMYKKSEDSKFNEFVIGLLILAFKDLATENLTIGGGTSIGRGRFKGNKMIVINGSEKIEIDFSTQAIKGEDILNKYILAVSNYKIG